MHARSLQGHLVQTKCGEVDILGGSGGSGIKNQASSRGEILGGGVVVGNSGVEAAAAAAAPKAETSIGMLVRSPYNELTYVEYVE